MNHCTPQSNNCMIQLQRDQTDNLDFPLNCPVYVCSSDKDYDDDDKEEEPLHHHKATTATATTTTTTTKISYAGTVKAVFIATSPQTTLLYQIESCIKGKKSIEHVPKERIRFQNGCPVFVNSSAYCCYHHHGNDDDKDQDICSNDAKDIIQTKNRKRNTDFEEIGSAGAREEYLKGVVLGFCDVPLHGGRRGEDRLSGVQVDTTTATTTDETVMSSFWYSILLLCEKDVERLGRSILHQVNPQHVSYRLDTVPKEISVLKKEEEDKGLLNTCIIDLCTLDDNDNDDNIKEEEEEENRLTKDPLLDHSAETSKQVAGTSKEQSSNDYEQTVNDNNNSDNHDTILELKDTNGKQGETGMDHCSSSKKRQYAETLDSKRLETDTSCWWEGSDSSSSSVVEVPDMMSLTFEQSLVGQNDEHEEEEDDDGVNKDEQDGDDNEDGDNNDEKENDEEEKNHGDNGNDAGGNVMSDNQDQHENQTKEEEKEEEEEGMQTLNPAKKRKIEVGLGELAIVKLDDFDSSNNVMACKEESIMDADLVIIDDSDGISSDSEDESDNASDPLMYDLSLDDNHNDNNDHDASSSCSGTSNIVDMTSDNISACLGDTTVSQKSSLDLDSFMIGRKIKSFGGTTSLISKLSSWRTARPGPFDEWMKEFDSRTYYWCQKCRDQKGLWALHHEDDHVVDNGDSFIPHWTVLPPNEDEPHSIEVKGMWFSWCEECRGGKGQWSLHAKGCHWKCLAPMPNEPLRKMKGNHVFYWCHICRNGRGMWARHQTSEHDDEYNKKPSATLTNEIVQNLDYQGDKFSQFLNCEQDIFRLATTDAKNVPNSSQDPSIKMCITYHLKGHCRSTCKRAVDHVKLSDGKVKELYRWCKKVTSPPQPKPYCKTITLPYTFDQIQSE